MSLPDGEREALSVAAQRAASLHEPDLRRLGAIGIIGIGLDPSRPTWRQWWARCLIAQTASLPVPLLAEGYPTAGDAMAALVELACSPRAEA